MTPLVLALVDLAAGVYLVGWAYRRERRDRPGVLAVGCVLLACGLILAVLGRPRPEPMPAPTSPDLPAVSGTAV